MPSWTDRNQHDPGITLLELFLWIALGLLFGRRLLAEVRRRLRDGDD